MKPIAIRTLYSISDSSKKSSVMAFAPEKKEDGFFYCKVTIENAPEGLNEMEFAGVDSFQALLLAINSLNTMVNGFNKKFMDSKLRWVENSEDLGFSISNE